MAAEGVLKLHLVYLDIAPDSDEDHFPISGIEDRFKGLNLGDVEEVCHLFDGYPAWGGHLLYLKHFACFTLWLNTLRFLYIRCVIAFRAGKNNILSAFR